MKSARLAAGGEAGETGKAVRNLESAAAEIMGVLGQLKGVPDLKGAAFARPPAGKIVRV